MGWGQIQQQMMLKIIKMNHFSLLPLIDNYRSSDFAESAIHYFNILLLHSEVCWGVDSQHIHFTSKEEYPEMFVISVLWSVTKYLYLIL
jgi:hypothetical protein